MNTVSTKIKLAHLVPGGDRIVAPKSDHRIPTSQTGLVVGTIRAVLAQVDAGTPRRRRINRPALAGYAPSQT